MLAFVTSCLLAAVVLAWNAQTRIAGLIDQAPFTELGDHLLGKPLMLAAGAFAFLAAAGALGTDQAAEAGVTWYAGRATSSEVTRVSTTAATSSIGPNEGRV